MYEYIQISKINDFIFCPFSVYLHSIYENFDQNNYHRSAQTKGKIKHECIDGGFYSTSKNILQGLSIFSDKLGIIGKIDIYDKAKNTLVERKNKIVKIYDGYKYQLYAQRLCLEEMGYAVEKMLIHSLSDNKNYPISLSEIEIKRFFTVIENMKKFDPKKWNKSEIGKEKCKNCIYYVLCDLKC